MLDRQSHEYELQKYAKYIAAKNVSTSSAAESKDLFYIEGPSLEGWRTITSTSASIQIVLQKSVTTATIDHGLNVFAKPPTPRQSPFTAIDVEEQVQSLLYLIGALTSYNHREKISNRLYALHLYKKEEQPSLPGIRCDSLRSFYNFLSLYPRLKYPAVTLTSDHNIYASWKEQDDKLFSIHFLSNDDVRFVVFSPEKDQPDRTIRLSGTATVHGVVSDIAKRLGILDWISE
jgi:hypothetical protein